MDKKERMQYLVEEINKHNYNYYVLDNPTISDAEYDKLYYELVDLEAELGTLPDSPTQRVGGETLDKFEKRRHAVRLYSMNKVRSFLDLENFMADMRKFQEDATFSLEYKFDGLTLVLEYENGQFRSATTRGNGEIGEDVTLQAKTIKSIPLKIPFKKHLIVQGEGMMTLKAFKNYNKKADEPLKNPRNGVAGAIRNLDPKKTRERDLDCFCYAILLAEDEEFATQQSMHDFLQENGFLTGDFFKIVKTAEEAEKIISEIDKVKNNLNIMIDGMVIKLNETEKREEIGYTNKFPKWAMAYKFEATEISTMLNDVIWQVGRSGKVSPIAVLEPVELAGATITRATLNNIDDIRKKGVMIGSKVFIRRSNEVIPEVLALAEKFDSSQTIEEPINCPCCGAVLEKRGPLVFCTNRDGCWQQIIARLTHFVSREAFNIEGLSEKTLLQLYKTCGVCEFTDLYRLTAEILALLDGFKEKKISNILSSIERSKKISLSRYIFGLGIPEVGVKTAKDLAKHFGSLENLQNASYDELLSIEDVGDVIADNIKRYFADEKNKGQIEKLFALGVTIEAEDNRVSNVLSGLTFVLTGTLPNYSRVDMTNLIEKNGGKVTSSVSKNTSYVLAGEEAGSKLDKAKTLNVKIITEQDLLKMLGSN